jgi:hypothetical protein
MKKFNEEIEPTWSEVIQVGTYVVFMCLFGLVFATCLLIWLSYIYGEFII